MYNYIEALYYKLYHYYLMKAFEKKSLLIIIAVLFIVNIFVWGNSWKKNALKVAFLDVGQGDAIYIEAPNGNQLLIDGGQGRDVLRGLSRIMRWHDRSLDVVLATHPDNDHTGGLPEVIARYNPAVEFDSGFVSMDGAYGEMRERVAESGAKSLRARNGMKIDMGDGAVFTVLSPMGKIKEDETNEGSVVARLEYGDSSFLFTGDAPKKIEEEIARSGLDISADVLKVAHHGSKSSLSSVFYEAVNPAYAVISVGEKNRYGHPDREVIDALQSKDVEIIRTDKEGDIVFTSDGVTITEI